MGRVPIFLIEVNFEIKFTAFLRKMCLQNLFYRELFLLDTNADLGLNIILLDCACRNKVWLVNLNS